MKAVRLHKIGDLRCDEVPVPVGKELLIRVGAVVSVARIFPEFFPMAAAMAVIR